jgi:hypothetical protein
MNFKRRLFAATVHLGISFFIAALAWALVSRVLYPYPYIEISGGRQLFLLLVSVDVLLGAVLTFSVFSVGKLRNVLIRDLAVIGALQLTALGYGLWTMYAVRPVYLVHEIDRFKVVTAADLDQTDLDDAPSQFQRLPISGVRIIGLRLPRNSNDKLRSLDLELAGKELSLQTSWWQPLDDANRTSMRQQGKSMQLVRQRAGDQSAKLDQILRAGGVNDEQAIALPLLTRLASWSVVLDKRDLKIIGYLPIDLF